MKTASYFFISHHRSLAAGLIFLLLPFSIFGLSEAEWKNKNLSFTKHLEAQRERQRQKKSLKSGRIQQLKKDQTQRLKKQRRYTESQVIEDKKAKAKLLLQTFLDKKPSERSLMKKQFLKEQKEQNSLKKKYAAPFSDQLFLK